MDKQVGCRLDIFLSVIHIFIESFLFFYHLMDSKRSKRQCKQYGRLCKIIYLKKKGSENCTGATLDLTYRPILLVLRLSSYMYSVMYSFNSGLETKGSMITRRTKYTFLRLCKDCNMPLLFPFYLVRKTCTDPYNKRQETTSCGDVEMFLITP